MLKSDGPLSTPDRIVAAAFESLRVEGFAGTSARSIARRGGFNQSLIFYHFGTLNELLLETLDRSSAQRMERYESLVAQAHNLADVIKFAGDVYKEDLADGHITVLSEMITGSLAQPELRPAIVKRMRPWIEFAEGVIDRFLEESPFSQMIDRTTLATAVVALYLGIDLLGHLDEAISPADKLFESARTVSSLLEGLFPANPGL